MRSGDIAVEVKKRLLISSVIRPVVDLKGHSPNFLGLCPFHQEKTPSFHVRDQEGRYKCFGCGESGDIFNFIMRLRGLGFKEAVNELALQAGVINLPLPKKPESSLITKLSPSAKNNDQELLRAQSVAQSYFSAQLGSPAGIKALNYLQESRNLAPAMVKQAALGFGGLNNQDFLNYLKKNNISPNIAINAGLIKSGFSTHTSSLIGQFLGRITFPIRRSDGKIIAFGARILSNEDPSAPKYLNTHAYLYYEKKKNFYGLFESRPAILKGQSPVLVEGYFDAMAMWAIGVPALALCGTALSDEHANILKALSAKLILCLDGDEAGFNALRSSLVKLWRANITTTAVTLEEKDPGDYLAHRQLGTLKERLSLAQDATCLVIDRVASQISSGISARMREIDLLLPIFSSIARPLMRRQYVAYLAQKIHEDPSLLWSEINKKPHKIGDKLAVKVGASSAAKPLSTEQIRLLQILKADAKLWDQVSLNIWQQVGEHFKDLLSRGEKWEFEAVELNSAEAQATLKAWEEQTKRAKAKEIIQAKRRELQLAEKEKDFSKMFGNLREQSSILAQAKPKIEMQVPAQPKTLVPDLAKPSQVKLSQVLGSSQVLAPTAKSDPAPIQSRSSPKLRAPMIELEQEEDWL